MPRVLIILAHPQLEHARVTSSMLDAVAALGPQADVQVRDLYALYPDYLIDVAAEQAALQAAQLVVWLHPLHWYSMPPLLKLWQDEVLQFGWAYGPGGQALSGRDLWWVTSTGAAESSYRPDGPSRYFFDAFVPPFEQTAALCGMRFLPPMVLHGAHQRSQAEIEAHAQVFAERLATYPHWPEIDELPPAPDCQVPSHERPAESGQRGDRSV